MEARLFGSSTRRLAVLPLAALAFLATAGTGAAVAAPRADSLAGPLTEPSTTTNGNTTWLTADVGGAPLPTEVDEGSLAWIEQMLHVPQVWSAGYTGAGIDVALIDSGVAPVAGLDGANIVNGPDLSFESGYVDVRDRDTFGHGTHMASIIAGKDSDLTGIAPGARVISLKVATATGATDVTQVIAAIDWVARHAHDGGRNIRVLNLSYGTDSVQAADVDPLSYAVERAWKAGIVVVAAAGNDGTTRQQLADPATNPYVLAVGADDTKGTLSPADDTVADFAQRGTTARHVDIIAPGLHVLGLTVPNGFIDQTHPAGKVGERFIRGSGTSQATAIVSGVAALVAQRYPDATPDQLKYLITRSGFDLTEGTTGTAAQRLEDLWQGYGVVDAARALAGNPALAPVQNWPAATGTGSLDAARGSSHVAIGEDVLTGEQDIFGTPWAGPETAASPLWLAAADGTTGLGGTVTDWTGTPWVSRTWVSRTWVASGWDSRTWVSDEWLSRTWVSRTWVSRTWVAGDWVGGYWDSRTWVSRTWAGDDWS
jgi:serine protease AprX